MRLSRNIKPISYLKSKTAEVINTVTEKRQSIIVTQNGEAKAVIQDIKSYEETRNAIAMLKMIVQAESEIQKGETSPQRELFQRLETELFG